MTILEKLENRINFTVTENQVVEYILEHFDKIETLTIDQLARETFTSHSTIIRVCQKLSLKGFKELKMRLVQERETNKFLSKNVNYSIPFQFNETSEDIIDNIYSLYKESINLIHSQIDKEELIQISQCLLDAKRIFIFAIGDSKLTAKSFINKMIKINLFPILATENNEELFISHSINKEDCALFITYSGQSPNFDQCLDIIKSTKTIVLTSSLESNLVQKCRYHIVLPNVEKEYKIATFYSQLALQYILNIIFSIIYNKRKHSLSVS